MSLKIVSEDMRRVLHEFGEGNWKCAKYIEIKEDCVIGNHFHLLKDECFLLVEGEIVTMTIGTQVQENIRAPFVIDVPRGLYHKFRIKAGSKIVGLMSEHYDQKDDMYK